MNTEDVIDDLVRALEMEETMNNTLSSICAHNLDKTYLTAEDQYRIRQIANQIQGDTLRHMNIVNGIIKQIKEQYDK